ncbi:MAG TPA: hypothetical protein VHW00_10205 [Thermoanaerobaculia bacterium]|nr:hypothetical protein [Thermoanaerobaculia bacterium]
MKSLFALVLLFATPLAAHDSPETVVTAFYSRIVADHPLGIPEQATKDALWPLMTPRLTRILEMARACEADYTKKHANSDEKPEFWWLEAGLFSGANEMALPAKFEILGTEVLPDQRQKVTLRFTYAETLESSFLWRSAAIVDCRKERCLVDDFVPFDIDTAQPLTPLSESFGDCKNGKWIGR